MPRESQSAARAHLVAKRLAALGLAHLADVAVLLVCELVGDAVKCADGRTLLITVRPAERGARVVVTDVRAACPP
ncbi:hypothetical protein ACFYRC_29990 [Streptomyces sp. NPDC005279]|uniref:hypothetical protein n=1 Tax=Streptomyces sp. NPDC005279 TaxID=3364712 RepID=UPI003677EBC6